MFGISSHMLLTLLFTLIIFLIFRELICWYWKLNSIDATLKRIAARLDHMDGVQQEAVSKPEPQVDASRFA